MLEENKSVKMAKRISKFQKIFVILFMLSFVLLFIYCLGFATPFIDVKKVNSIAPVTQLGEGMKDVLVSKYCVEGVDAKTCGGVFTNSSHNIVNLAYFVKFASDDVQNLNHLLFGLSIGGILISLLLFVYRAQIRKRYYITNYIAAGICTIYSLVTCIVLFVLFGNYNNQLNNVEYDIINKGNAVTINLKTTFSKASFDYIYAIGNVILIIMLIAAAALVFLHIMKFIAYKDFDKIYNSTTSENATAYSLDYIKEEQSTAKNVSSEIKEEVKKEDEQ